MAIPALRATQQSIKLPDDVKEKALRWVQTQAATAHRKPTDAPFPRLIDFWFAAIAWAVHTGLRPVETASGSKFVSIGPTSKDVNIEDWKCDLLRILAVNEFGHENSRTREATAVVDLGNRYAEAGAVALIAKLESVQELTIPMLYRIADLFTDETSKRLEQQSRAL
jgi:hypothetical protein